jgi:signal transduction histidine kinase
VVSERTACPECARTRSLSEQLTVCYTGRPEHTANYLRKIERSGLHLLQIVNDILDFSRMGAGQLRICAEHVTVSSLVKDVIDEMRSLAEPAGVRLLHDSERVETQLFADPLRIRQVLINLIGNAIKFSDGRGTVTVLVEEELKGHLFCVRDEGIGIARDKLETVFASFEQVHKGTKHKVIPKPVNFLSLNLALASLQLSGARR